jgi:hypothetical protein
MTHAFWAIAWPCARNSHMTFLIYHGYVLPPTAGWHSFGFWKIFSAFMNNTNLVTPTFRFVNSSDFLHHIQNLH